MSPLAQTPSQQRSVVSTQRLCTDCQPPEGFSIVTLPRPSWRNSIRSPHQQEPVQAQLLHLHVAVLPGTIRQAALQRDQARQGMGLQGGASQGETHEPGQQMVAQRIQQKPPQGRHHGQRNMGPTPGWSVAGRVVGRAAKI